MRATRTASRLLGSLGLFVYRLGELVEAFSLDARAIVAGEPTPAEKAANKMADRLMSQMFGNKPSDGDAAKPPTRNIAKPPPCPLSPECDPGECAAAPHRCAGHERLTTTVYRCSVCTFPTDAITEDRARDAGWTRPDGAWVCPSCSARLQ